MCCFTDGEHEFAADNQLKALMSKEKSYLFRRSVFLNLFYRKARKERQETAKEIFFASSLLLFLRALRVLSGSKNDVTEQNLFCFALK